MNEEFLLIAQSAYQNADTGQGENSPIPSALFGMVLVGVGTPEGVVTATIPAVYIDNTPGDVSFYVFTGTLGSNTGWQLIIGAAHAASSFTAHPPGIVARGIGSPEGVVTASTPGVFIDNTPGDVSIYVFTGTLGGNTGWLLLVGNSHAAAASAATNGTVQRGTGSPEGLVTANGPDIYIDITPGSVGFYAFTGTVGNNTGWLLIV